MSASQEVIDRLKCECWCGHKLSKHTDPDAVGWRRCQVDRCYCYRFRSRVHEGKIDMDMVQSPVCPHCGDSVVDYWDYGIKFEDGWETEITCGSCEKNYKFRINISYDFTTLEEEKQDETNVG